MKFMPRLYKDDDFMSLVVLWRIAREKSMPDFQRRKGHFFYEDVTYFRDNILIKNTVWVVDDEQDRPVAFIALKDDLIDHLYVHPDHWRQGIGEALIRFAQTLSPQHLWLYTLQDNANARAFYEKNGFVVTQLGISPAPENEPDVKYEWFGK
jgi:GNAT superfamily N-acetyltransferase